MPVKWDTEARYNLLLMINGQDAKPFSQKIEWDDVAKLWNALREDQITPRAIQEQVKFWRKEINNGTFGVSLSAGVSTPRTPRTPARSTVGSAKRSAKTQRIPASAKRARKNVSDEVSTHDLTEEAEAESSSDDEPATVAQKVSPRKQPTRTRVQAKTYTAQDDSSDGSDGEGESASDFSFTRRVEVKNEVRKDRSPTVAPLSIQDEEAEIVVKGEENDTEMVNGRVDGQGEAFYDADSGPEI